MTCSLSPTVDDVYCDLPATEPVSFHWHITVSATEAFLLPDPECGTLYLKNSDRTHVLDSLGTNWNHTCLSRLLNHGALWQIVFLRLINILTYLLTYITHLHDVLPSLDMLPDWTDPSRHTSLFYVTSTYHLTDLQIVHGVVAWVVPTSSGQTNYRTTPTTHLEICGGMLVAMVTMLEQRDSLHRLHSSGDYACF